MCTIPTTVPEIKYMRTYEIARERERERERQGSKLYGVWRCTSLSWLEQLIGLRLPNANRYKCQGHCTPCVHTRLVKGIGPRGPKPRVPNETLLTSLLMSIQVFSLWSEGPTFAGSACTALWEMSTDCDKGKVQVYRSASNAWLWFVVTLQSKQMSCNNIQHASIYMKIVGPSWAKLVKHVQHRTSVNHAGQVALIHLHAFTWNESAAGPFPAKGWRNFLLKAVEAEAKLRQETNNLLSCCKPNSSPLLRIIRKTKHAKRRIKQWRRDEFWKMRCTSLAPSLGWRWKMPKKAKMI